MNFKRKTTRKASDVSLRRRLRRFSRGIDSWLAASGINPYQTAEEFSLDDTGAVCDAIARFGERAPLKNRQISDLQVGWSLDLDANGPEIALSRLLKNPRAYLSDECIRPHRARLDGEADGVLDE
ncbi:MAG TPA: hypothetical protein VJ783_02270 [Pirellulales bacterium]|nr:hypothetical protein [Pirellulales bacterium]